MKIIIKNTPNSKSVKAKTADIPLEKRQNSRVANFLKEQGKAYELYLYLNSPDEYDTHMEKMIQDWQQEFTSKDYLHDNGDKSYYHHSGGYNRLEAQAVPYLDAILKKDYVGWAYMPELTTLLGHNKITKSQFDMMMRILD